MQVQCPLFCTNRSYCDFVLLTSKTYTLKGYIPLKKFGYEKNVDQVKHFFNTSILPELLGKFYSHTSQPAQPLLDVQQPYSSGTSYSSLLETIDTTMDASNNLPTYCDYNEGKMVGCDNPNCVYKWFHIKCLKLATQLLSTLLEKL